MGLAHRVPASRHTSPGVGKPAEPEGAWSYVADWLAADQAWVPHPGDRHADILGRLVVDGDLRGNLVTDAHLAALAIEHGVAVSNPGRL